MGFTDVCMEDNVIVWRSLKADRDAHFAHGADGIKDPMRFQ